jgi:o-succinylbenzoate synthase
MLTLSYQKYTLFFRFEAGTSRGVLTQKDTYFLYLFDSTQPQILGIGEASPLAGLSIDDLPNFETQVQYFCQQFDKEGFKNTTEVSLHWIRQHTPHLPSLCFGIETALKDLANGGIRKIYDNDFYNLSKSIPINGLVWMGTEGFMKAQIEEKLKKGFKCIKMKIGAIDFDKELTLLQAIRKRFSASQITLRVDANGAFAPHEAFDKLKALAQYDLHSIEQPIKPHQRESMAQLCAETPLAIALDEELIGIDGTGEKNRLLDQISPHFIILKPTLLGGLEATQQWIDLAEQRKIGWWITSALESNIGLNAICQFTAQFNPLLPQGLGTGQLYHNNIEVPLVVADGQISYLRR